MRSVCVCATEITKLKTGLLVRCVVYEYSKAIHHSTVNS